MPNNELIEKYKNKILNVLVVIIAIFIANNIYKNQTALIMSLNKAKDMEEKKNLVLGQISELEKKFKVRKDFINNKDISLSINNINGIAQELGVKINAIRPQEKRDYPLYTKYPFDLSLNFKDYHQLGTFISRLESHQDIYIIEKINIRKLRYGSEDVSDLLSVDLTLSTVLVKE